MIRGGAHSYAAMQAELDATDDVIAALARWSAVRDQPRPVLARRRHDRDRRQQGQRSAGE